MKFLLAMMLFNDANSVLTGRPALNHLTNGTRRVPRPVLTEHAARPCRTLARES